jgi:hypothetical protein
MRTGNTWIRRGNGNHRTSSFGSKSLELVPEVFYMFLRTLSPFCQVVYKTVQTTTLFRDMTRVETAKLVQTR